MVSPFVCPLLIWGTLFANDVPGMQPGVYAEVVNPTAQTYVVDRITVNAVQKLGDDGVVDPHENPHASAISYLVTAGDHASIPINFEGDPSLLDEHASIKCHKRSQTT
jgi:hypothetical protein